jgi:hypothetical protein
MPFQRGQSGNPAGRPLGSRKPSTMLLQSVLENRGEKIAETLIKMAEDGDIAAIRICMDRLLPKQQDYPTLCELPPLEKPADTVTAMAAIVQAVAAGDLTPAEADRIARLVDVYLRALAAHGFEERLAALENTPVNQGALTQGDDFSSQLPVQSPIPNP